jgi:hypothetical protein
LHGKNLPDRFSPHVPSEVITEALKCKSTLTAFLPGPFRSNLLEIWNLTIDGGGGGDIGVQEVNLGEPGLLTQT